MGFFGGGWKFSETPLRYVAWRQVISKFQNDVIENLLRAPFLDLLEYPARQRKEAKHHFEAKNLHLKTLISSIKVHLTSRNAPMVLLTVSPISHYPNSQPNPLNKAGCISNIQPTRLYLRHQPNRVTQTYPTNASELTQHFATRSLEPSNWMSSNDSKASVLRPTQGPERNASSSLC